MQIARKRIRRGYPVTLVLRFVGLSRSTYYHHLRRWGKPRAHGGGRPKPGWSWTEAGNRMCDEQIKQRLLSLIEGDGYYYGYRKLTHALRRDHGLLINKKKVYRLCKEMDILSPQPQRLMKYPRKVARIRNVTGSNQLWEMDIKYGYIEGERRFFQIASIIDVFDRCIVGYYMGITCPSQSALEALAKALKARRLNKPGLVLRSDNGPQFNSRLMREGCKRLGVSQEFIPFQTPDANAHIESFHSILERECLADNRFENYWQAYQTVEAFVRFYNSRRLHSACGYRPPEEYYRANRTKAAMCNAVAD